MTSVSTGGCDADAETVGCFEQEQAKLLDTKLQKKNSSCSPETLSVTISDTVTIHSDDCTTTRFSLYIDKQAQKFITGPTPRKQELLLVMKVVGRGVLMVNSFEPIR